MTQGTLFTPGVGGLETETPYPWGPAAREADTSQAAATDIAPRVDTLRTKALAAIVASQDGLTADEVAATLGESILSIRPRITELGRLGHIADAGQRRTNASGKRAIVWRVA